MRERKLPRKLRKCNGTNQTLLEITNTITRLQLLWERCEQTVLHLQSSLALALPLVFKRLLDGVNGLFVFWFDLNTLVSYCFSLHFLPFPDRFQSSLIWWTNLSFIFHTFSPFSLSLSLSLSHFSLLFLLLFSNISGAQKRALFICLKMKRKWDTRQGKTYGQESREK